MGNLKDMIKSALFIVGCGRERLDPVRQGCNLSQNDVWVGLSYFDDTAVKLNEVLLTAEEMQRENANLNALLSAAHIDSGFRCLDESLQTRIEEAL